MTWFWKAAGFGLLMGVALSARADDLLGLYQEALQSDAIFLAAQADTRAQHELLPQARAQLLPNLSWSGSQSRKSTEQVSQGAFGSQSSENDYDSYNYALSLRQPLFRVHNFALYRQSLAQVSSANATLESAAQEVAVRVGTAYFDVLLAQSELDVNQAQQEACRAQLDYAQKAFVAGAGTRTDIDEAQSRLDLSRAQAMELEYRLEYAKDALQSIVARPLTPLASLNPGRLQLTRPDPERLEEWIRMAESVNPRLKALKANIEAAEQEIWKARAGHFPTVDLVMQRSRSDSDYDNSIGSAYDTKMVGVQVNFPLFSGGYVNSTVRQARAMLEKQRQQLEAARRETVLEVRKEFDAASQGIHWVEAYEQAVKSAEQTLFSTKKGFQAGTRNTLDILNAERDLSAARQDLNRGRYQYILARLKLLSLVGRLDAIEMGHFNAWLETRPQTGGIR
ncbi:MAG: TolC family outer membrane protein [Zoogloeaceae bacterium]|jgi:TolC family type I secretion outer membrane protein|nr:TolC family outer membrane protein [Zoogloeaceae bacterium]